MKPAELAKKQVEANKKYRATGVLKMTVYGLMGQVIIFVLLRNMAILKCWLIGKSQRKVTVGFI